MSIVFFTVNWLCSYRNRKTVKNALETLGHAQLTFVPVLQGILVHDAGKRQKTYSKFHSQFLLTLTASCELYIFILCTNWFRSERILDYIFERGDRHAGERNTFFNSDNIIAMLSNGLDYCSRIWPFLTLKHQACYNSSICSAACCMYKYSTCSLW